MKIEKQGCVLHYEKMKSLSILRKTWKHSHPIYCHKNRIVVGTGTNTTLQK